MVKAMTGELQSQVVKETDCVSVTKQTSDTVNINKCKWNQSRQSWLDREYDPLHPPLFTAAKYFMFPSRPVCQLCTHWFCSSHLSALERLAMSGPSISPCTPISLSHFYSLNNSFQWKRELKSAQKVTKSGCVQITCIWFCKDFGIGIGVVKRYWYRGHKGH